MTVENLQAVTSQLFDQVDVLPSSIGCDIATAERAACTSDHYGPGELGTQRLTHLIPCL